MSEQVARIVELRRLRPVKWSAIEKKTKPYRDGYVDTFLAFEGRPLIDEDGQPITDARDRQLCVTAASFVQHHGLGKTTFNRWLFERRGYTRPRQVTSGEGYDRQTDYDDLGHGPEVSRSPVDRQEQHGQCSHCPEWTEE